MRRKAGILSCLMILAAVPWVLGANGGGGQRAPREPKQPRPPPEAKAPRKQQHTEAVPTFAGVPYEASMVKLLNKPALLDELELTDEQKKVKDQIEQAKTKADALRTDLENAGKDMVRVISESNVENVLVTAAVDKVSDLRAKLAKVYVSTYFALKQILTPEQMQKVEGTAPKEHEKAR